ncbi:hypothetical protein BV22DRAFT_1133399 [Leucogyrophana mollusca]|uniref:Uncharacterized protein n=1 Tax=Leucogyrophana mollusca TaxID=85980 RepID=A0ACB8B3C2_9AGAM|nr:hypothetical protein BV22DRAFT_1133399 [Leucogyrophana mollusca]
MATNWTEAEEAALITYLLECRPLELNFTSEIPYSQMLPHTSTPISNICEDKMECTYKIVCELRGWAGTALGIHYDDTHGVLMSTNDSSAWDTYTKHHTGASASTNKGFPHYDALNEVLTVD